MLEAAPAAESSSKHRRPWSVSEDFDGEAWDNVVAWAAVFPPHLRALAGGGIHNSFCQWLKLVISTRGDRQSPLNDCSS